MIIDCNQTKYEFDVVDQMCSTYNVGQNSKRWPLTVFLTEKMRGPETIGLTVSSGCALSIKKLPMLCNKSILMEILPRAEENFSKKLEV
nr:unnamed protein product [Callosobruchus analis]